MNRKHARAYGARSVSGAPSGCGGVACGQARVARVFTSLMLHLPQFGSLSHAVAQSLGPTTEVVLSAEASVRTPVAQNHCEGPPAQVVGASVPEHPSTPCVQTVWQHRLKHYCHCKQRCKRARTRATAGTKSKELSHMAARTVYRVLPIATPNSAGSVEL